MNHNLAANHLQFLGGVVAECSKALLLREKVNENIKKISGSPPGLGNLFKNPLQSFSSLAQLVAQANEHPSKGPWSRCNSTDVGSKHAAA